MRAWRHPRAGVWSASGVVDVARRSGGDQVCAILTGFGRRTPDIQAWECA
ncbi:hypothetical protein [Nonomuraea sp. NPDC050202]